MLTSSLIHFQLPTTWDLHSHTSNTYPAGSKLKTNRPFPFIKAFF